MHWRSSRRPGELRALVLRKAVLDEIMADRPYRDPHIWIRGATVIVRGRRVEDTTKTGRVRRGFVANGRLGHADPSMTLRVYAHVLRSQRASSASRFARIMGEAEGPEE